MSKFFSSLKSIISPLSAFFMGTVLTCCAFSLLSSTLALRMTANGIDTAKAGIVLSLYYLGYVVASLTSYRIINKVGHIRAFCAFISTFSAVVPLHYIEVNATFWGLLRLFEGYCIGSCFLCLESWLNTRANNKNRGIIMSLYMLSTYFGSSFGQLLLNIQDKNGLVIYMIVSGLFSIALVPISLTALPTPDITVHKSMPLKELYKKVPVGVVGCFASGFLVGAFYTLGAIYAHSNGLSIEETSIFMFFGIFGGMLAQLPIGKLSDYFDRRYVLMWTSGFLFLIAPWMHYFIDGGKTVIALSSLLLGCGIFVMYPISVSHANDKLEDSERTQASGMLILLQSMGLIIGPILISAMMQFFGNIWFLLSFSIVTGAVIIFTFKQIATKDVNYITNTPTTPQPVAPTHVFNNITEDVGFFSKVKQALKSKKH